MRRVGTAALILVTMSCLRGVLTSPREQEAPKFRLVVHLDETFRSVQLALSPSDAGATFEEGVTFPEGGSVALTSSNWHRGPGLYTLAMTFQRADGGTGAHVTPFELRTEDLAVAGFATFFRMRLS